MEQTQIEQSLLNRYYAAMFRHVGGLTKFSRSGSSVVFSRPVLGRSDLSSDPMIAAAQLRAAGIDADTVTEADVAAYESWLAVVTDAKRRGAARIVVSRWERHDPMGQMMWRVVPMYTVRLIDGLGDAIAEHPMERTDDRERNRAVVLRAVQQIRDEHPEFAHAPLRIKSGRDSYLVAA